jgi:hypothetical protein
LEWEREQHELRGFLTSVVSQTITIQGMKWIWFETKFESTVQRQLSWLNPLVVPQPVRFVQVPNPSFHTLDRNRWMLQLSPALHSSN